MTHKQAHRRYMKLAAFSMVLYIIGIMALSWTREHMELPLFAIYGLLVFPVFSILLWMWGMWRYVTEIDEFLRSIQVKSIMYGLAIMLAITSGWGLLEFYSDVPKLPIFYAMPIFTGAYGIAHIIITKREGGVCS